ncbi:EAL domain-containing protein (putative c-di-GMP-specific phosphodiesterase class I) [Litorivivens lipolytica]|uniref:EAL domain-containing protein (Putative c-di-GMP-specific phosphodiesterase class I) n=1 Tax=Litorivivens lipolytica TaxID=1524264 RepID=A0A7W4W2L6_9GAMM|nr:EAL domain-containing protein [Litorivivens lipolytica]MBB3046281.1 EAL domain-containing protein (putative c-di-GMP-specific phosphodiesterase class I) [Litorivivens lipolytica]
MDLKQFFPHYQPIVDIYTGQIGGYEALARCKTKDGSIISAWPFFNDEGINADDKLTVDRHIRATALATFATRTGGEFISVNISPSFMKPGRTDLGENTLALLDRLELPPYKVVTEIMESPGKRKSVHVLAKRFREAGLQVAIDDFGAGYSHMERLFDLRPDYLKIDMNLFRLASKGGVRADYLQALRYVTERNNIKVVCEGVETEDEFMFAVDCGARYIQGFLFSGAEPNILPADKFTDDVSALRQRYLAQKSESRKRAALHQAEVNDAILALKELILAEDLSKVEVNRLRSLGILRFFVCRANGEQVSSNYNVLDRLTIDRAFCGFNWSTRPYFPELIARRDAGTPDDYIIHSSTYKDQERQELCRTYGINLSANHLLLVDVSESDLVSYVK